MAIPRTTFSVIALNRMNELPRELPALPQEVATRFPKMEEWQTSFSKWWFDFRTILQEQDLSAQVKLTASELAAFKASTSASLSTLQSDLADLIEQLAAIQDEVDALDLAAINAALVALQLTVNALSLQVSNLTITVANSMVSIANLTVLVTNLTTIVNTLVAWQTPQQGSGDPLSQVPVPAGRFVGDTYWDIDQSPPGTWRFYNGEWQA